MVVAIGCLIVGLALVVWSADRFVDGAASTARYFGMPALLVGMLIVGLGTSAPEMVVSALAALDGSPGLALGNAYGSNIANIGLVLGISAVICPIMVGSTILRKELPLLLGVSLVSLFLLWDLDLSRIDAAILIGIFVIFFSWTIYQGMKQKDDSFAKEIESRSVTEDAPMKRAVAEVRGTAASKTEELEEDMPIRKAVFWLIAGLVLLIVASRIFVYGATEIATALGVSDIIVGLTVVAIGTSLPELASSIVAARKGEHDIALGNVLGSNMFNTLLVVGIAGLISPMGIDPEVVSRDLVVMMGLTVLLFVFGFRFRKTATGRINRFEGVMLVLLYLVYTVYLVLQATGVLA